MAKNWGYLFEEKPREGKWDYLFEEKSKKGKWDYLFEEPELRLDETPKGQGYFGVLKRPDKDVSTELSIGVNFDGKETLIPSLVPTLTREEIDYLLSGEEPTDTIIQKATYFARQRIALGKSPFAQPGETFPLPEKKPGLGYIAGETLKGTGKEAWKGVEPIVGTLETGVSILTGIAGFFAGLIPITAGKVLHKPGLTRAGEKIAEILTHEPKTEFAQFYTERAMAPFAAYKEVTRKAGEAAGLSEEAMEGLDATTDVVLAAAPWIKKGGVSYLKSAALNNKLTPKIIRNVIKQSGAPEAIKKMAVEELGIIEKGERPTGNLGRLAIRDKSTGEIYGLEPGEGAHFQIMDRLIPRGIKPSNMQGGFFDEAGKFYLQKEAAAKGIAPRAEVEYMPTTMEAPPISVEAPITKPKIAPEVKRKGIAEIKHEGIESQLEGMYEERAARLKHKSDLEAILERIEKGTDRWKDRSKEDRALIKEKFETDLARENKELNKVALGIKDYESRLTLPEVAELPKPAPPISAEAPPISAEVPRGEISAGGLAYGMELPSKRLGQTLAKWGPEYEIKKFILDTTDSLENQIRQRKRGVVTWEQTAADADALSMTPESLSKMRRGTALNDAQIYRAGEMTKLAAQEALETNKKYMNDPTPENYQKQVIALATAQESLTVYQGAAAEAGRALNILKKTIDPSLRTQEVFNKFLKDYFGDPAKVEELIKKFATIDQTNMKAVYKFLKETRKATTAEMIHEGWLASILSFPVTHGANITGSLTFASYAFTAEKALMAGVEFVKHPLKPSARQAFFGEIPHAFFGLIDGFPEGVRRMAFAWKNEVTAEGMSKLEFRGARIPGKAGKAIRGPLRALMAEDEFFKGVIYHSELSARSYAWAKREGLKGEALAKRIAELKENPPDALKTEIRDTTLRLTFQNQLGKFAQAIASAREIPRYKAGGYVIPFMRTMVNIIKVGLERGYLPYSLPSAISKTIKAAKGKIPKIEATRAQASLAAAATIPIAIAILKAKGMITGAVPKDPQERWLFYQAGYQPYSFIIKGKAWPYGRIEPLATMLGATVDTIDIIEKLDEEDQMEIVGRLAWAFSQNFFNKTFMLGIVNLLNVMSDPERYGGSFIKTYAGSAVPSLIAGTARAIDPSFREVKTFLDLYKSRTPIVSKGVPPAITPMGEEKKRPGTAITRLISPVQPSKIKEDIVLKELLRLKVGIGYPAKKIGGKELTREQHRRYTQIFGNIVRPQLVPIISSPEYKKLEDEEKELAIKRIIDTARDWARAQFRQELGW